MKVTQTDLPGCLVLEPQVFGDERGYFYESYNADKFATLGLAPHFVQGNVSSSARGVLRARVVAGTKPTLGICMGMQLFCESSEESPGVVGLGALPIAVRRFPSSVSVPQLGWNKVEVDAGCRAEVGERGHARQSEARRPARARTP